VSSSRLVLVDPTDRYLKSMSAYSPMLIRRNAVTVRQRWVITTVPPLSRKNAPAERNYEIYDKEMLAIVRCLEEWDAELHSEIRTDYKNLEANGTTNAALTYSLKA
jgi:hypothetical protein